MKHGKAGEDTKQSNPEHLKSYCYTATVYLPLLHCPYDSDRQVVKTTTLQSVNPLGYTLAIQRSFLALICVFCIFAVCDSAVRNARF
jgi:hypothetical protein